MFQKSASNTANNRNPGCRTLVAPNTSVHNQQYSSSTPAIPSGTGAPRTPCSCWPQLSRLDAPQEPFLSARALAWPNIRRRGLWKVLRTLAVAVHDVLRGVLSLPPAYIKAVGRRGDLALLEVTDEEFETFMTGLFSIKRQGGWQNLIAARSGLAILGYNPVDSLGGVRCPVLFVAGERDYLCPPELIRGAFGRAPEGSELVHKSANHFELFRGLYVEEDVIPEMVRFAVRLCGRPGAG